MRTSLAELIATGRPVLADGATGTNFFRMGLESGYAPELWNVEHPERVLSSVLVTNTLLNILGGVLAGEIAASVAERHRI